MKGYLNEINQKNETNNKIVLKYSVLGGPIYITLFAVLNVIYCYLKFGNVSTDHLYYPGKLVYVLNLDYFKVSQLLL